MFFFLQNKDWGRIVGREEVWPPADRGSAWCLKKPSTWTLIFCFLNLLSPETSRGKWIYVWCFYFSYFHHVFLFFIFSSWRKSTKRTTSTISFLEVKFVFRAQNDSHHNIHMPKKNRKHKVSVGYGFFSYIQWYLPNVSVSALYIVLAPQESHIIITIKQITSFYKKTT